MTRSPHTMGDDVPSPASATRHVMFSLVLHVVGRPVSRDTPWLEGPRHWGQFCANVSPPATPMAATASHAAW